MDESIKTIRVVFMDDSSFTICAVTIRAVGWYTVFGKLILYTIRGGRRRTVAEFENALVVAVMDTACEVGKAVE